MRISSWGVSLFLGLLVAAPAVHAEPLLLETELTGASGEKIHLIAGEFVEGQDEGLDRALEQWLLSRLGRGGSGQLPYFEVTGIEFSEGRTPQALGASKIGEIARKWGERLRATIVKPVQRLRAGVADWAAKPENRSRVGFALLSAGLDGGLNVGTMILLQGTPLPAAMAVGAAIASISGAWTYANPEVARFLAGSPSLVDRILGQRESIARQGGKMLEGLIKWGLIEFVALSVISAVSSFAGVSPFESLGAWALSNAEASLLATLASGTFDFSLGYELDQALQSTSLTERERRRFIIRNQVIGITAGTLGTLGGVAQMMGQSFGGVLLYGLTALGVANLARVEWKEVTRLRAAISRKCSAYLLSRAALHRGNSSRLQDFPNYGSE